MHMYACDIHIHTDMNINFVYIHIMYMYVHAYIRIVHLLHVSHIRGHSTLTVK